MRRTIPAQFFLPSGSFNAAYLSLGVAELRRRAEEALELLRSCIACPRDCHVNRLDDKFAVCKTGRYAIVSSFFPHFGEEDCLRGWNGSGTIFFSMCNLRCVFCLGPDTPIMTEYGWKLVGDIFDGANPGISVNGGEVRFVQDLRAFTREGKLAPINKAFRHQHRGELILIRALGTPSFALTANHQVFAARTPGSAPQKIPAGALTTTHWLVAPKLHANVVRNVPATVRHARNLDCGTETTTMLGVQETADVCWVPITELTSVRYEGPVYNLEIGDPDHSYLAGGIAVGNCQNYDISQQGHGRVATPQQLAAMMLHLQDGGCHNINFVTPEHVVPQILEALPMAVAMGLTLPIVYNTSSYDSMHSLRLMDGIVDIYMPDFKFWDREMSRLYMKAPDYPEVARQTIKEMHRQVGPLKLDEFGLARRGVLIRHLVMPGRIAGTQEIMRWIAEELGPDAYVNVMAQYYPAGQVGTNPRYEAINRRIFEDEFDEAVRAARDLGLWRLDARIPRRPSMRWSPATSPVLSVESETT